MSRLRVLLVSHDPRLLLDVHAFGAPRAYDVFATPDYSATSRQAYELRPDAVLIAAQDAPPGDWHAALDSLHAVSAVPIAALVSRQSDADWALAHGATLYVMRPYDGRQIESAISRLTHPEIAA
ncbi:MAG: hypothetical protein HZB53_15250 [Chloroflexi bacterium]|nr:hypothetical protein [Chloroflexota bacterium]